MSEKVEISTPQDPLLEGTPELFDALYNELRRLAKQQLRGRPRHQTLNVTALVNEAFIKLSARNKGWQSEEHFLRTAARAVRQIIVDHARATNTSKRGAKFERVTFEGIEAIGGKNDVDALQLDAVLAELEAEEPGLAQVVELRYFCGLTIEETSRLVGVSESTIKRDWNFARAWLFERMSA